MSFRSFTQQSLALQVLLGVQTTKLLLNPELELPEKSTLVAYLQRWAKLPAVIIGNI